MQPPHEKQFHFVTAHLQVFEFFLMQLSDKGGALRAVLQQSTSGDGVFAGDGEAAAAPAEDPYSENVSEAVKNVAIAHGVEIEKVTAENLVKNPQTMILSAMIASIGVTYYLALEVENRDEFLRAVCWPEYNADMFGQDENLDGLPMGRDDVMDNYYEEERCHERMSGMTPTLFKKKLDLVMGVFMRELAECTALHDKAIAMNQALTENVFLMVICAELRIPLFIVGKPGTSKSLARSLVDDGMKGKSSPSLLFQNLKQCVQVSYQCSPLSTSEGIVKVFRDCSRRQRSQNLGEYVAVAVLDEVGLAEDSKNMALKCLHPLLETGCSPDGSFDSAEPYFKVGFYGISNWALDPAKMNRGILVSRGEPDQQELVKTGAKILHAGSSSVDSSAAVLDNDLLQTIVDVYEAVYSEQGSPEIHGLRDFYCLIKMIAAELKKRFYAVTK